MTGLCNRDGRPHPLGAAWLTLIAGGAVTGRRAWRFCSAECLAWELEDYLARQAAERLDAAWAVVGDEEAE
jgi:hypothetical protein